MLFFFTFVLGKKEKKLLYCEPGEIVQARSPVQWLCFVMKEVPNGSVLLGVQLFCSSHFEVKCSGNWVYEQR